MAAFVDGGGVPLDKYKRAAARVPLPLKFDDAAQVGSLYYIPLSNLIGRDEIEQRFGRVQQSGLRGNAGAWPGPALTCRMFVSFLFIYKYVLKPDMVWNKIGQR